MPSHGKLSQFRENMVKLPVGWGLLLVDYVLYPAALSTFRQTLDFWYIHAYTTFQLAALQYVVATNNVN